MQEGLVGPSSTAARTGAARPKAERRRNAPAVLPRSGLLRRLVLGVLPVILVVGILATVDHFVTHLESLSAPLLLAVVLGAFVGGMRAAFLSAVVGAVYLAVHEAAMVWPPTWTTTSVVRIVMFVPCAIAAALLVGLLQRRALERYVREREHGERMATLERVKSQFLNVASHELRGPLGVARGYVSMVQDGSFGHLDAVDMRKVAPVLTLKLSEMNTLVNEMLDTARLEESRLTLSLSRVDLGALVQHAVEAVTPLATERHEVLYSPPRTPLLVIGDEVRLNIIVTNLLQNAVKYSPRGGVVQCFATEDGGNALVSVWDQGLGIAPDDLPRLFSRFGRLVTRENSHIAGTGLGLYLARELARLHGGDITVRSSPGAGSSFTLVVPMGGPRHT